MVTCGREGSLSQGALLSASFFLNCLGKGYKARWRFFCVFLALFLVEDRSGFSASFFLCALCWSGRFFTTGRWGPCVRTRRCIFLSANVVLSLLLFSHFGVYAHRVRADGSLCVVPCGNAQGGKSSPLGTGRVSEEAARPLGRPPAAACLEERNELLIARQQGFPLSSWLAATVALPRGEAEAGQDAPATQQTPPAVTSAVSAGSPAHNSDLRRRQPVCPCCSLASDALGQCCAALQQRHPSKRHIRERFKSSLAICSEMCPWHSGFSPGDFVATEAKAAVRNHAGPNFLKIKKTESTQVKSAGPSVWPLQCSWRPRGSPTLFEDLRSGSPPLLSLPSLVQQQLAGTSLEWGWMPPRWLPVTDRKRLLPGRYSLKLAANAAGLGLLALLCLGRWGWRLSSYGGNLGRAFLASLQHLSPKWVTAVVRAGLDCLCLSARWLAGRGFHELVCCMGLLYSLILQLAEVASWGCRIGMRRLAPLVGTGRRRTGLAILLVLLLLPGVTAGGSQLGPMLAASATGLASSKAIGGHLLTVLSINLRMSLGAQSDMGWPRLQHALRKEWAAVDVLLLQEVGFFTRERWDACLAATDLIGVAGPAFPALWAQERAAVGAACKLRSAVLIRKPLDKWVVNKFASADGRCTAAHLEIEGEKWSLVSGYAPAEAGERRRSGVWAAVASQAKGHAIVGGDWNESWTKDGPLRQLAGKANLSCVRRWFDPSDDRRTWSGPFGHSDLDTILISDLDVGLVAAVGVGTELDVGWTDHRAVVARLSLVVCHDGSRDRRLIIPRDQTKREKALGVALAEAMQELDLPACLEQTSLEVWEAKWLACLRKQLERGFPRSAGRLAEEAWAELQRMHWVMRASAVARVAADTEWWQLSEERLRLEEIVQVHALDLADRLDDWDSQCRNKLMRQLRAQFEAARHKRLLQDIEAHMRNQHGVGYVMRRLRGARAGAIGIVKDANGELLTGVAARDETRRRVELWFKASASNGRSSPDELKALFANPLPVTHVQLTEPVTVPELKRALKGVKNASAPGPSGLPTIVVKELPKEGLDLYVHYINLLLQGKELPEHWRRGEIVLIPKQADRLVIENNRPLTMLEVTYKLYTKVLMHRLGTLMEANGIISDEQSGFRAKRDTALNAYVLSAVLDRARRESREIHAVFLDWKKAYDSVPFPVLRAALEGMGLAEAEVTLVMNLYQDGKATVRTEFGHTEDLEVQKGVRQGDPLSPLLFNLVINSLVRRLARQGQTCHSWLSLSTMAYADDIVLLAPTAARMEALWAEVIAFAEATEMSLGIGCDKTVYTATRCRVLANLHAGGVDIPFLPPDKAYKYLGFWISLDGGLEQELAAINRKMAAFAAAVRDKHMPLAQRVVAVNAGLAPFLRYHFQLVWWADPVCQAWRAQLRRLVCQGTGFFPSAAQQLFDPVELGGLGLADPLILREEAMMSSAVFRQWTGRLYEEMGALKGWCETHPQTLDPRCRPAAGLWWSEWWSQNGKVCAPVRRVGQPQWLYPPENPQGLRINEEALWRACSGELIVATDGSQLIGRKERRYASSFWTPLEGLEWCGRSPLAASTYDAELRALEALLAALPLGERYLVAVDNKAVVQDWVRWTNRGNGVATEHVAWHRMQLLLATKWGTDGVLPIRVVHVYSHVQEKLRVPAEDSAKAEGKRRRIALARATLQDKEGCLLQLEAANERADQLATRGLRGLEAPPLPAWLIGEPEWSVRVGTLQFRDWDAARAALQDAIVRPRADVAASRFAQGSRSADIHLARKAEWRLMAALTSAPYDAALAKRRVWLLGLSSANVAMKRPNQYWQAMVGSPFGAELRRKKILSHCAFCGQPWTLAHCWHGCATSRKRLGIPQSAAEGWWLRLQHLSDSAEVPEKVATYLASIFRAEGLELEARLCGWWPKDEQGWTTEEFEKLSVLFLEWTAHWETGFFRVRQSYYMHYRTMVSVDAWRYVREQLRPGARAARGTQLAALKRAREDQPSLDSLDCPQPLAKRTPPSTLAGWLLSSAGSEPPAGQPAEGDTLSAREDEHLQAAAAARSLEQAENKAWNDRLARKASFALRKKRGKVVPKRQQSMGCWTEVPEEEGPAGKRPRVGQEGTKDDKREACWLPGSIPWAQWTCAPDAVLSGWAALNPLGCSAPPRIAAAVGQLLEACRLREDRNDIQIKRDEVLVAADPSRGWQAHFSAADKWVRMLQLSVAHRKLQIECPHGRWETHCFEAMLEAPNWEFLEPMQWVEWGSPVVDSVLNEVLAHHWRRGSGCCSLARGEGPDQAHVGQAELVPDQDGVWMCYQYVASDGRVLSPWPRDSTGKFGVNFGGPVWFMRAMILFNEQEKHYRVLVSQNWHWVLVDDMAGSRSCPPGAWPVVGSVITHVLWAREGPQTGRKRSALGRNRLDLTPLVDRTEWVERLSPALAQANTLPASTPPAKRSAGRAKEGGAHSGPPKGGSRSTTTSRQTARRGAPGRSRGATPSGFKPPDRMGDGRNLDPG
jgi:hypothetical protein